MHQQINLYQPVAASSDEPFSAKMMMLLVGLSCILMMAFYGMLFWTKNDLKVELTSLSVQLEQTKKTVEHLEATVGNLTNSEKEQKQLQHLKNIFNSKKDALNDLSSLVSGNNKGLSDYFYSLARKNIEAIWFENINVYSGGEHMNLYGQTSDAKSIPGFVLSLKEESVFKGVSFKLFNVQKNEKDNILSFVLQTEIADAQ